MAARKTPSAASRSGSHVPNSLRGTARLEIRCTPEEAERARRAAKEHGRTLAEVMMAGVEATERS